MESIHTARYILGRYYPRTHLMAASALAMALVAVLFFGAEPPAHGTLITDADRQSLQVPRTANTAIRKPIVDSQRAIATETTADEAAVIDAGPVGTTSPEPATVADTEEGEADPEQEQWTEVVVRSGDTLSSLFSRVGLSAGEMHRVLESGSDDTALDRLYPGYRLRFLIPESGRLQRLQVHTSPLRAQHFTRTGDQFQVESVNRAPEVKEVFRHGQIDDSLFMASQRADIPVNVTMEMANIFGGVIDFILDPRRGDQFSILYEEEHLDGQQVGTGEVIAARFINRGREYIALRYEKENGEAGYFNPRGESMRKAFLRNPMEVFRISSNFNPNRRHPILNTIRAHKGTDYAAPRGTPVRATADGTVTWAARNGSFGKLVVIKHHGSFETKYAHLNNYANGIRKGARVTQGQVLGYVGATGSATGPHLHYEFLMDGVHRNPRTVLDELPQAVSLAETELPRFREYTRDALDRFRERHEEQQLLLSLNDEEQALESTSHD